MFYFNFFRSLAFYYKDHKNYYFNKLSTTTATQLYINQKLSATRQEGRRHYTVPKGWQWASAWFILWLNQAIPIKKANKITVGCVQRMRQINYVHVMWQDNIIINILKTINGWHPFKMQQPNNIKKTKNLLKL